MFGLTPLGVVHTAISLVAVIAGIVALVRDKRISGSNGLGKVYVITTALTCLTAFGIFQHGGFARHTRLASSRWSSSRPRGAPAGMDCSGRASRYVETVGYSATLLFHMVPAITEITTRLPLGAPLLPGPDAPALQVAAAVFLVLFCWGRDSRCARCARRRHDRRSRTRCRFRSRIHLARDRGRRRRPARDGRRHRLAGGPHPRLCRDVIECGEHWRASWRQGSRSSHPTFRASAPHRSRRARST